MILLPIYEDQKKIEEIEDEMAHIWTKFRAGDTCRIVSGWDYLIGNEVTIRFPYWFLEDGEQTYVTDQHAMSFKESELEFVKQKLYGFK